MCQHLLQSGHQFPVVLPGAHRHADPVVIEPREGPGPAHDETVRFFATDSVQQLATVLICINAVMMPFNSYTNATYFTLRSGGQTMVTFLFDSCFVCCVCVPVAFCLSRFTGLSIVPLFLICQSLELVKCAIGAFMLKQGKWIQNLTV